MALRPAGMADGSDGNGENCFGACGCMSVAVSSAAIHYSAHIIGHGFGLTVAALKEFLIFGYVARIRIDRTAVHCKVGVGCFHGMLKSQQNWQLRRDLYPINSRFVCLHGSFDWSHQLKESK